MLLINISISCFKIVILFFGTFQVMFYEALKDLTEHGKQKWVPNPDYHINGSLEGLLLGGLAGGMCCTYASSYIVQLLFSPSRSHSLSHPSPYIFYFLLNSAST